MVVGDIIEYGILDKAFGDNGAAQKKLDSGNKSPRRIGSILSFMAIGPQYNAITSLGILSMGNFIFFFQLIMQHYAKTKPKINPLYRVRVHGWICLVNSVIALGPWIYFCCVYEMGDSDLVTLLKKTEVDNDSASASKIAEALAGKMREGSGKEVEKLVQAEFDITGAVSVGGTINNVEVTIDGGDTQQGEASVTVVKKGSGSAEIKITVKGESANLDTKKANKIAKKLASALTKVTSVNVTGGNTTIPVKIEFKEGDKIDTRNFFSPLLLFPIGSAAKDFLYPVILPSAFLDPKNAALVNYLTPLFFMTGSIVIVLLNDVFTGDNLGFKLTGSLDAHFKKWSASTADKAKKGKWWHVLWALNIPKYIALFIAMFGIHGTFPSLRCIVQSRWRVLLLTIFIIIPRATLEVAGYVGVANYAIGRADGKLAALAALVEKLKEQDISSATDAEQLKTKLEGANTEIKELIKSMVDADKASVITNVEVSDSSSTIEVKINGKNTDLGSPAQVTVGSQYRIQVKGQSTSVLDNNSKKAEEKGTEIAKKIKEAVEIAQAQGGQSKGRENAKPDFEAFAFIAAHDMLAMFSFILPAITDALLLAPHWYLQP